MGEMSRWADISADEKYRWALGRQWEEGPVATFVMLNPSTADAEVDDPTIRRCMYFAEREGCGGLVVVNLYAWRATSPGDLWRAQEDGDLIAGLANFSEMADQIRGSREMGAPVIAAWGAHSPTKTSMWRWAHDERKRIALNVMGPDVKCLGTTKDGEPRHPLYVKGDKPLEPYVARNEMTGRAKLDESD